MPEEKKMLIQRTEPSSNVSEFNLTEVGKEKIKLNDLLKSLKKRSGHQSIKQQLKNTSKEKKLEVPLSKPQADRIKRSIAYEKVAKEVKKWDVIVRSNRAADQIVYPLKQPDFSLEVAEDFVKRFQSKNALEQEVSKLLNSSENVLDQKKELTAAEEKALKAMSLAEAKARHGELKRMRALLSHKEAKARRQKKIKSKKYHRILKKEKMKKLMKEFEELQKTDPEAAKEKLQEADNLRILERMTLKHKTTGKWAKQQQIRAKYNPESRSALKAQMNIGKQLTEKVIPVDGFPTAGKGDSDDDDPQSHDVEDGDLLDLYKISTEPTPENPQTITYKGPSHPKVKVPNKRKPDDSKESNETNKRKPDDSKESNDENLTLVDESCERLQTMEDFDNIANVPETVSESAPLSEEIEIADNLQKNDPPKPKQKKSANYVSETDFSSETKILESMIPDDITFGDEELDDENEDKMNIRQAFADEDFISEFKEDKKAAIEREKPEGINLFLPGWGSWGGTGIRPSKKKRRRFYIKPIDTLSRKDDTLGNVIINEDKDKEAAVHQVSDLPFQYKSVGQFESMIRQPIGNTWNPETSFQKVIAPKVVTKLGKIIDPINADDVTLQTKPTKKKKKVVIKDQKQKHQKRKTKNKPKGKKKV